MTRRNLELLLLLVGAPVVVVLFAMLNLRQGIALSVTSLGVPLGIAAAFLGSHLAIRRFAPEADPAVLPIVFVIAGIGMAFVTRLAPKLAVNQVIWLFIGVACMVGVLIAARRLERLAQYKYTFMIAGIALLLSPLVPGIGQEILGSRIWLHIGPFSFQPGELAKIAIVLFLAGYLSANREMLSVFTMRIGPLKVPDLRTLLPLLLMWALALVVVVFEKDLGSAVVFFFVFLAMLYAATGKKTYLVVGGALMAAGIVAAWLLFSHVQTRVSNWIDPFADAQGAGYQMVQALYAIADGDLFGRGIGSGMAGQIPVVESDFIFAAIAEEAGLLGAAGLLMLFLGLAIRGYATAARAKTDFSSFLAVGLTTIITLQAFIIVGGVTGLIPLTGLTLPFVSQGGSSLVASFIAVGFLLRCGDEATGVGEEMANVTVAINNNSVLGRVSLGRRLTNSIMGFSLMFALLVGNLTMIMVVKADEYRSMPGNNHTLAKQARIERGIITTADNVVLAQSARNDDGTYSRVYPAGDLASQVVGYYSAQYGTSGIEAAQNDTLTGERGHATWLDVLNEQAGITQAGNSVELSINARIQAAAQQALQGYTGACVVMDPTTGAVLAMASSPTYRAADFASVIKAGAQGGGGESSLLNRATQSLYAPGSTFKMVSAATALETGEATLDSRYGSPGSMDIGGAPVTNFDGNDYGVLTLRRAIELSSNTVFGQIGRDMGAKTLVNGAQKFGFGRDLRFDLPTAVSLMADPATMSEWETAWAAVGQPVGDDEVVGPQATVLQMALVGAGIANEGTVMRPYLVQSIFNGQGERSFTATPSTLFQALDKKTALDLRGALEGVVSNGTGTAARIPGVKVAGKTGTAETGKQSDDSWFVGMAPADKPRVVVAIVLEQDGIEGDGAAKAQNVLKTALAEQGVL
ncbi:FtsW/RodA/SpoVE family cell cycle protein [Berryella wangjianweii]|uniref:FtsW/RodA/SpoVE family cell cycle protein n=1 Tax=Berryella wangjianweii TaxID=2734634 RepID=A0A6M8J1Y9_9ACTN|nr:FtsW/RodA/SpoVE family cell cycle protein [Berryella wangjianweii]QKF07567.1 FtsW/RodA/SpoVE family cell cycle protein [Berryella wangjianweii]